MTTEEIKTRIEKKKNDISKIEKRIKNWTMKKDSEKEFEKEYGWLNTFEQRKDDFKKDWVEKCEREMRSANKDLAEKKATLEKYVNQLNKEENFGNMEKIPAIWDFLQEWRKAAYDFFVENIKLYSKLRAEESEKWNEFKETPEYKDYITINRNDWRIHINFREKYYEPIHKITYDVYTYQGKWDDEKLNKILDKDVQNKYNDLVSRITDKAGVIQDASGLYIAGNGTVNGVVVGDKNKVKVETILAGGYNVQILHYRVLVNVIK